MKHRITFVFSLAILLSALCSAAAANTGAADHNQPSNIEEIPTETSKNLCEFSYALPAREGMTKFETFKQSVTNGLGQHNPLEKVYDKISCSKYGETLLSVTALKTEYLQFKEIFRYIKGMSSPERFKAFLNKPYVSRDRLYFKTRKRQPETILDSVIRYRDKLATGQNEAADRGEHDVAESHSSLKLEMSRLESLVWEAGGQRFFELDPDKFKAHLLAMQPKKYNNATRLIKRYTEHSQQKIAPLLAKLNQPEMQALVGEHSMESLGAALRKAELQYKFVDYAEGQGLEVFTAETVNDFLAELNAERRKDLARHQQTLQKILDIEQWLAKQQ